MEETKGSNVTELIKGFGVAKLKRFSMEELKGSDMAELKRLDVPKLKGSVVAKLRRSSMEESKELDVRMFRSRGNCRVLRFGRDSDFIYAGRELYQLYVIGGAINSGAAPVIFLSSPDRATFPRRYSSRRCALGLCRRPPRVLAVFTAVLPSSALCPSREPPEHRRTSALGDGQRRRGPCPSWVHSRRRSSALASADAPLRCRQPPPSPFSPSDSSLPVVWLKWRMFRSRGNCRVLRFGRDSDFIYAGRELYQLYVIGGAINSGEWLALINV
ncbi:hypothetical protein ZIOFF_051841 [Zingiber officinale]|uniref:Uncharacterized protein n=1 Tax=Zingiber officinale TaxID=94328 RepID=A0A8J5FMK6_ZINOF|nr:hypothetical protein ZIOFF_051841 [Zingiber officinale]